MCTENYCHCDFSQTWISRLESVSLEKQIYMIALSCSIEYITYSTCIWSLCPVLLNISHTAHAYAHSTHFYKEIFLKKQ